MLVNPIYGTSGTGPEPSGKDVLIEGVRFVTVSAANDVYAGGINYEPQSE